MNKDTYNPIFILTWSPKVFPFDDYDCMWRITKECGGAQMNWSTRSKQPKEGNRFVLLRQGSGNDNGIVAYGTILSESYEGYGEWGRFMDIYTTKMWNLDENYPRTSMLKEAFPEQCWTPQFSGIRVKASITPELWSLLENWDK